jgi:hypothetical protein
VFSFVEIFIRPAQVFDRVREKKIWISPFLIAVILLCLPTVMVILSGGGIELLTLQRYEHSPKMADAVGGGDAVDRAVNSSNERWTKTLIVSRTAGSAASGIVILSVAFMLASGFLDRRPDLFATIGTLSYAVIPFAFIGSIVTLIMLNVSLDHSNFDLDNMPALNLSRLLDRTSSSVAIFSMAEGMDLLIAGEMLLMSFGLTHLTRLSYLQALVICGGLWTVAVIWNAALTVYL